MLLANIYNQSASTQAINEPFIPTSPLTANKSTLKEGNKGNAYIKKYKKKKKKKSIEPNKSTYGMHNLTLSECAEHKAVRWLSLHQYLLLIILLLPRFVANIVWLASNTVATWQHFSHIFPSPKCPMEFGQRAILLLFTVLRTSLLQQLKCFKYICCTTTKQYNNKFCNCNLYAGWFLLLLSKDCLHFQLPFCAAFNFCCCCCCCCYVVVVVAIALSYETLHFIWRASTN